MNEYGLDVDYFSEKLSQLLRDVSGYTPAEMARALIRLSVTAKSSGLSEREFAGYVKGLNFISADDAERPEPDEQVLLLVEHEWAGVSYMTGGFQNGDWFYGNQSISWDWILNGGDIRVLSWAKLKGVTA
jgi:hypothetical protein